MSRASVAGCVAAVLVSLALPAPAVATSTDPEISSERGSVHHGRIIVTEDAISYLGPPGPASSVDIRSAWFTAVSNAGEVTGFHVDLRLWEGTGEAVDGTRYAVSWSTALGCTTAVSYVVGSGPQATHLCGHNVWVGSSTNGWMASVGCACEPVRLEAFEPTGDGFRWTLRLEDLAQGAGADADAYHQGTVLRNLTAIAETRGYGITALTDEATTDRTVTLGVSDDVVIPEHGFTTQDDDTLIRPFGDTVTGWAADAGSGIARVTVVLAHHHAPYFHEMYADLDCTPDHRTCTWDVDLGELPPGGYTASATSVDKRGNVNLDGPSIWIWIV